MPRLVGELATAPVPDAVARQLHARGLVRQLYAVDGDALDVHLMCVVSVLLVAVAGGCTRHGGGSFHRDGLRESEESGHELSACRHFGIHKHMRMVWQRLHLCEHLAVPVFSLLQSGRGCGSWHC